MRQPHGIGLLPDRAAGPARGRAGGLVLGRGALAGLHAVGRLPAGGRARGRRRPPPVRPRPRRRHPDRRRERACSRERSASSTSSTPRAREAAGEPAAAGPVALGAFATAAAGLVPEALASLPRELEGHRPRGDDARADPGAARRHARPRGPRPHAAVPAAGRRLAAARAHHAVRARAGRRRRRRPSVRGRACGRGRPARGPGLGRQPLRHGDALLGVWPGLAERPDVRYVVRDWLAKLQIVAAGLAITTLAPSRSMRSPPASASSRCGASRGRRDGSCSRAGPSRSTALRPAWPTR